MGNKLVGKGELPDVLYVLYIVELHALQVYLWNLVDVLLVVATHHDIGDASALGSQDFLLDATNGQHLAS